MTVSISMCSMCALLCLLIALSRRVGALEMSIIIIITSAPACKHVSLDKPTGCASTIVTSASTDHVPVLFSKTTIERLGSVQLEARVPTHVWLSGPLRLSKWAELFRRKNETSVKIAAFRLWIIKLPHYSPFGGIPAEMCPRNGRRESV